MVKVKSNDIPEILQNDDPRLHLKAKEVPIKEITSPKMVEVIEKMKLALKGQADGIGLAAPQIGISLRIFIVSGRVLMPEMTEGDKKVDEKSSKQKVAKMKALDEKTLSTTSRSSKKNAIPEDLICINPVIIKESKEKIWMEGEGCLSVRWLYGKVKRSTKVTLRAYDENGKVFTRGASGLLAHIFQHESDHLDGILFIDKAKDLQRMTDEEVDNQIYLNNKAR